MLSQVGLSSGGLAFPNTYQLRLRKFVKPKALFTQKSRRAYNTIATFSPLPSLLNCSIGGDSGGSSKASCSLLLLGNKL